MSLSIYYYAASSPLNFAFNALKIKSIYGTAHNFFTRGSSSLFIDYQLGANYLWMKKKIAK